uniref:Ribosomal_L18e/L15P domain-containing protein n=1 Tax=Macrostomum lignano TaxID=282301 RepID=A0A1I8F9Y4_9PLAT
PAFNTEATFDDNGRRKRRIRRGYSQRRHGCVRTSAVLNPATAASRCQSAGETTARTLRRRAYMRGLKSVSLTAFAMDNFLRTRSMQIRLLGDAEPPVVEQPTKGRQDPIFHPGLVKDSPTSRQDAILLQLSPLGRACWRQARKKLKLLCPFLDFETKGTC